MRCCPSRRRRGTPAATLLFLIAGCGRGVDRPNVLLVSIDSLRADRLGAYGNPRGTSPEIDRLAQEGVLFRQHVSSTSWTLPAHAALFTSLPDSLHGCTDTDRALADRAVTLAERFVDAGYATAGFYSGPYLHPVFGLAQGFETYEDCSSYPELMARMVDTGAQESRVNRAAHADVTGENIARAVSAWLDRRSKGKPFFLFVHMWDVHFDYVPPPPYDKRFDPDYRGEISGRDFLWDDRIQAGMDPRDLQHQVALYDGEIAWTDAILGRIRERLEAEGLLDRTLIALTSDHGDEFFEHGNKAHRRTVYDEVVLVPLVLRFPGVLPPGVEVRAQTRCIDVGPTLAELAGLEDEEGPAIVGRSLLPLVRPGEPDAPRPALCELYTVGESLRGLRTERFKIVDDLARGRSFFFDLERDPREQAPRADFESPLGAEARATLAAELAALAAFAREHDSPGQAEAAQGARDVPAEVLERLKKLGYVDDGGDGGDPDGR